MVRLLNSRFTYIAIRSVGLLFLVSYLLGLGDWRLSLLWALAFPAISFSVASLFVILKLSDRFPSLNRYLLVYGQNVGSPLASTENERTLAQASYLENGLRRTSVLAAPLEDGFVCVPLLLVGLNPLSAIVGGIAFGAVHLARFTYIECIGKALYYTLVCFFVLPHGLLTVATGHLLTDVIGLVGVKIAKQRLTQKSRSNSPLNTDAPPSGGAPVG